MDKYLNKVLTKFQVKIDEAANNWNRNKDPKYKDLLYKLVKEFANGPHNTKRRIVSISAINKGNDGAYLIVGKSRLFRPMRYRKVKINNVS